MEYWLGQVPAQDEASEGRKPAGRKRRIVAGKQKKAEPDFAKMMAVAEGNVHKRIPPALKEHMKWASEQFAQMDS